MQTLLQKEKLIKLYYSTLFSKMGLLEKKMKNNFKILEKV